MHVPVTLPALGEAIERATISAWLKSVGDTLAAGEPLVEVSTDKVDTEIESPSAGVLLEIRVVEDEVVDVGEVIAVLGPAEDDAPESGAVRRLPQQPSARPDPQTSPQTLAAPEAVADEESVAVVPPTGPSGGTAPLPPAAAAVSAAPSLPDVELRGTTQKLSRLRRTIATRMVESLQTSAQLTTIVEVDVTGVGRARRAHNTALVPGEGVKLSYLPFIAVAAVAALRDHPQVNSTVDISAGTATYPDSEHLGIAVETPRGLIVPVIRDAGRLSVVEMAEKIADVAERSRSNRIGVDELQGGTFTITNTGSRGALMDTPIINQPQVAILGAGVVTRRPVTVGREDVDESIAIRSMLYLSLTYDHRIVDGADAASYLSAVKATLEGTALS